jgi:hypothetical protein
MTSDEEAKVKIVWASLKNAEERLQGALNSISRARQILEEFLPEPTPVSPENLKLLKKGPGA